MEITKNGAIARVVMTVYTKNNKNEYIFYNEKKAMKWLLKSFHYILNEDGDEDNIEFFFKNRKDFSFGGIRYGCRVDVKFF
ncbi:MAG: hypothetical protein QW051_03760 [Candidatus Aenigmatarchaeota archaeon]